MESVTLTRTPEGLYYWPSGRPAILPWRAGSFYACADTPAGSVLRFGDGTVRTFPSPTLAASALGARLPASDTE